MLFIFGDGKFRPRVPSTVPIEVQRISEDCLRWTSARKLCICKNSHLLYLLQVFCVSGTMEIQNYPVLNTIQYYLFGQTRITEHGLEALWNFFHDIAKHKRIKMVPLRLYITSRYWHVR